LADELRQTLGTKLQFKGRIILDWSG